MSTALHAPTHVVVATDFSPCSDQALRRADAVAQRLGARLTLLHVVAPLPVLSAWGDPGGAAWMGLEALQAAGLRALERQRAQHPDLLVPNLGLRCLIGQPRRDLGGLAADLGGDLLVLGAHPPAHLGQALLGSTAQATVHACPIPLLVCRRPAAAPWQRLLAATDFSPAADRAVDLSAALAPDASKRLLHVHGALPEATLALVQLDPAALARYVDAADAAAAARFKAICDRHPHWLGQFRRGEATDSVWREATLHAADLVAVGTRGHGPWLGGLLGSVGQRLLAKLDADVLLVPPAA